MFIVTGASGKLGRAIVEKLVDHVAPDRIGVSVRDPDKAEDLRGMGVRVRHGDFADPESLRAALEGGTQLLIVSSNARASGGDTLAQHRNAIDAAKAAGVERIVYTSHMGASATSAFPPMHDHAATEDMLAQCGLAWTALRHGFYASSGVDLIGDALTTGVIAAPADGKVAWTAHADLAAAAAMVLVDQRRHDGATPPLTGSQSLDLDDLATIASELTRRPITRNVLSDEALCGKLAERGAPPAAAEIAIGLYAAARAGEFENVDPTLERLLGRPPVTMRDVIADKLNGRSAE